MSNTKKRATRSGKRNPVVPKPDASSAIKTHVTKWVALDKLKPAPYNPRIISDAALKGLAASMKRFGLVEPIIWNEATGYVVGGHQRLKVLESEGEKGAHVMVVNLSESEEKALNVTLNNSNIAGDYTIDLADILRSLKDDATIPYDDLKLDQLLKDLNLPPDATDENTADSSGGTAGQKFFIMVECSSESMQLTMIEKFQAEGLTCKALIG